VPAAETETKTAEGAKQVAALRRRAEAATRARKHAEAAEAWRELLTLRPGDREVQIALCRSLAAAGDLQAARREALFMESITPADPEEWLTLHQVCDEMEDRLRQLLLADRFIAATGGNGHAYAVKALHLIRSRDFIKALDEIAVATKMAGDDSNAWRDLAQANIELHRPEEAIVAAQAVVRLCPDDWSARYQLFRLLVRGRHIREAERELRANWEAALAQPEQVAAQRWALVADLACELSHWQEAEDAANRASAAMREGDIGARAWLSFALVRLGRHDEATACVGRLVAANFDGAWIWIRLLELAQAAMMYDLAQIAGEQALRVRPGSSEIEKQLRAVTFAARMAAGGTPRQAAPARRSLFARMTGRRG